MPTTIPRLIPLAGIVAGESMAFFYGQRDRRGLPVPVLALYLPDDELEDVKIVFPAGSGERLIREEAESRGGIYYDVEDVGGDVASCVCTDPQLGKEHLSRLLAARGKRAAAYQVDGCHDNSGNSAVMVLALRD